MQLKVPKSCPFKIEYNENLNLRDLGLTNYFKEYLRIGLYQRSGLSVVNGQLRENRSYGCNERWGIYDQLVTIDKNSEEYQKYLNLSKRKITSELYNTYDKLIKTKYKIDINYQTLNTVKNYFN